MIKANELRIGNMFYRGENVSEVSPLDILGLYQVEQAKEKTRFSPIPLTEEWLVKFGFFRIAKAPIFQRNDFWSLSWNKGVGCWQNTHIEMFDLKYVHQLQNLYFALTGEELTIK